MKENELVFIQKQIGYDFNNSTLLQQAYTRRSYTEENGGENNELLEFIGDAVLAFFSKKFLITQNSNSEELFKKFDPGFKNTLSYVFEKQHFSEDDFFISEYSEEKFTEFNKILVQKKTLATRIDELGIGHFLLLGKGDIQNNISEKKSVKEDLFEAILGAIAIDCNWNMEKLQNAVEIMLAPDTILSNNDTENYVSLIQEWSRRKTNGIPWYQFDKGRYTDIWLAPISDTILHLSVGDKLVNESQWYCRLKLSDDLPTFRAYGRNQNEARRFVCKFAYDYINKEGCWLSISDEIDNPNKEEAINQLEILARRGYFSVPTYDFEQTYDNNGNPIWKSICHIAEKSETFFSQSSSKKEAKKSAAFKMLQYILND